VVVERGGILGAHDMRLAAVGELDLVARAAPGTADEQHQCATRRRRCSSITDPDVKRSSAKAR
jgi:hypothetical protein